MDLRDINLEDDEDIGILLVGSTGSGKSAVGNSILGYPEFQSRGGHSSVTRTHHVGVMQLPDGRIVKVVDTPGLNDTEMRTREDRLNLVIDEITQALIQFPSGFTAVVPVVPYNRRIPEEESKTIETMVSLLGGHESLASHGVLALTHGDAFRRDYPGRGITITEWIDDLPSKFQWIHDICNGKCVMFDNVTENEEEKRIQRDALIGFIDNLDNSSAENFIPRVCTVDNDRRETIIRDNEQVVRYIKAQRVLSILRFKIQMAIIDETYFTLQTETILKTEAESIARMMRNDRVFSAPALDPFLTLANSLSYQDEYVQNTANDLFESIINLQLKIDDKLLMTIRWQTLRNRVRQFFRTLFSRCQIL